MNSGDNALEYIEALGTNEMRWVEAYAKPRMNFHRSMESPEIPDDFLSLLIRYMKLAPCLVPTNSKGIHSKTLSHPDLHLDNIFIDPNTKKITHLLDWQSTSVSEMFLQQGFPPMLPHPEHGSSDSTMKDDIKCQDSKKGENQNEDILSRYECLNKIGNPRRWAAIKGDYISILTKPISLVCGAWDRRDVFAFRHALIAVIAHWRDIAPESDSFPINFTDLEMDLHGKEMELVEGLGKIMHQLQDENMIPLGGMVRPEHYDQAKDTNNHFKEVFISLGEDDQKKFLHSKVWPYQDT